MPRFYFPSSNQSSFVDDPDGVEFDTVEQARDAAIEALAEMARDLFPGPRPARVLTMGVLDEHGAPLMELRVSFEVTPAARIAPPWASEAADSSD